MLPVPHKVLARILPCFLALFFCASLRADVTQLSRSQLVSDASELVQGGQLVEAVPLLREIVLRFADTENRDEREFLAQARFFLGSGLVQSFLLTGERELLVEAIQAFTGYIENSGRGDFIRQAREARGDVFRVLGDSTAAVRDYEAVLERFSMTMSPDDISSLGRKYGEALYALREWEKAIPVFRRLAETGTNLEHRSFGSASLVEALVNLGRPAEIIEYLPFLVRLGVLDENLPLNVALIQASDALADSASFGNSALILSLVRNGGQVVAHLEGQVERLKARVEGVRRLGGSDVEEQMAKLNREIEGLEARITAYREAPTFAADVAIRIAKNYFLASRDAEAYWAYRNLAENFPKHPNLEDFLFAAFSLATKTGQTGEAELLGQRLRDMGSSFTKEAIFGELATIYDRRDIDRLVPAALDFIATYPKDSYSIQAIFMLGATFLEKEMIVETGEVFEGLVDKVPEITGGDGILYWLGLSKLFQGEFEEARGYLERLISSFSDSGYLIDGTYRYAIAHYADENSAIRSKAQQLFEEFVEKYPSEPLRGEVEYFLGEIAASEANLDQALIHYEAVARFTRNMDYITSSFFQMAALFESNGMYRRMAEVLRRYVDEFGDTGDLARAVLRLGESYKLQSRPAEMLNTYLDAIKNFGQNAKMASVDDIMESYFTGFYQEKDSLQQTYAFFVRLGSDDAFREKFLSSPGFRFEHLIINNPSIDRAVYQEFRADDGLIDLLRAHHEEIREKIKRYDLQRSAFPEEVPEVTFLNLYRDARAERNISFALRLFRILETNRVQVDNPMLIDESQLIFASPAVALWIAEREREADPALSLAAFDHVLNEFPLGDWTKDALIGKAELVFDQEDTDGALALLESALEDFPGDSDIYRAHRLKGDILLSLSQYDAARDAYTRIIQTPTWRGEAHASALLSTGISFFREGRFSTAHGYFERTFVSYPSFPEIAAAAYFYDAQSLEKLGDMAGARRTLDELLNDERFSETSSYPLAREMRVRL
ncbi:MAG: tetratricopeptide repeat protein [Puniceicoccaceae bacterium]